MPYSILPTMPNEERLLTTYSSAIFSQIGTYICQVIIAIQKQQPELLLTRYRNVQWETYPNQSALITKFTEVLCQAPNWDALVQKLQVCLKALLIPESLNSPIILKLIEKVQELNPDKFALNGSSNTPNLKFLNHSSSWQKVAITVLLLDAENLQITTTTEQFLTSICTYPIQVKIAFANWSHRGKLDIELHERGYDLIHVPAGRDNADGKMIAFGSAIHERYPNTKEVLVCSSDKVMTNLCNHLQQHGLVVYQVSQQGENITVFNSLKGKLTSQIVAPTPEMPSVEQFVQQIKELIRSEQKRTRSSWIKLAVLSKVFKSKHHFTISQVVSEHFPGKKAKDIFLNYATEFVVHQTDESSELYVTLFEVPQPQPLEAKKEPTPASDPSPSLSKINSKEDLEQGLRELIQILTSESAKSHVNISLLNSRFHQQYGKPLTEQFKALQMSSKFLKFLQSCSFLELKQTEKGWEVGIRSTPVYPTGYDQ